MGTIKYEKIRAMSLLSLLVILTMVVVTMVATAPIISQNMMKVSKGKKQPGNININGANGYFICYYNASDQLCYKQVEFDANNNVQETTSEKCENNGVQCEFTVPDADLFEIMLVGGGGGGAASFVENNFDEEIGAERIILNNTTTISPNLFMDYRNYMDQSQIRDGLNYLFSKVAVVMKKDDSNNTGDNACAKEYGTYGSLIHLGSSNNELLKLQFKTSYNEANSEYMDKTFYLNDVYQFGYNGFEKSCVDSISGGLNDALYGIKFKTQENTYVDLITDEKPLDIYLRSFVVKAKEGTKGSVGEIKKYKSSFIGSIGESVKFQANDIGKGGNGGIIDLTNNTYTPAQSGGQTKITLNGVQMLANGGNGGIRNDITYRLKEIKVGKKGENGERPAFYMPSQLSIDESNLKVGMGSTCKENGCSSQEDENSKFPGSSGASSGYNIGTSSVGNLNKNEMARMETEIDGGKYSLYPNDYDYTNGSELRPNLQPKMQNGGKGANGAILISW